MPTVQCSWRKIEFAALMLFVMSGICYAAPAASLSGVVRDSAGAVQVGAIVQVLASGSVSVATAVTDLYGRYRISNLVPGKYDVRASAPLFIPAKRDNLRLLTGARATVNLTLTMLSDPAAWLPAQPRRPDESSDDWTWTLRSAANRPILRILDDGQVVLVSPDAVEVSGNPVHPSTTTRVAMVGGDGGFATGTPENVITVDRVLGSETEIVLRTNLAGAASHPSTEVDAGYQRHTDMAGDSRVVVSYESHPEIVSSGASGLEIMRLASAQRMKLGQTIDVEAGGTVYAVHMAGNAIASRPFLRVSVHPGELWALRYGLATSRDLQGFDGLNSIRYDTPVSASINGLLKTEDGVHQEIALSRKVGQGVVEATVYHDTITHAAIAGTGAMDATDLARGCGSSTLVADSATGSFRCLGMGYTASGVSVMVSEPLASDVWATLEYRNGAALATKDTAALTLPQLTSAMRVQSAEAATAAVQAQIPREGTRMRVAYRWQPQHLLTPVASYEPLSNQAFLSLWLRQSIHWADKLPPGLEATVNVTNLLEQGYQPFLSADGRTLFLAQSPRLMQAGLSFTF